MLARVNIARPPFRRGQSAGTSYADLVSWLPRVGVAASIVVLSACGSAAVSSAQSRGTAGVPGESAPPACDTMLTGTVKDNDEQIIKVVKEATLTGAQLIDWLTNREKVHALHPESAFPNLTDAEVVRVCLFAVAGFHPPGPPGHNTSPNGATFVLRADHDPVLDVLGDLDGFQPLWDKLPT
jgi:hypothetical protein